MEKLIQTILGKATALLGLALVASSPARAADFATVFYLDETSRPVTRLDRVAPMSDGVRPILAMYTLQAGAGCDSTNEGLQCALTRDLGLGVQCSAAHVELVSSWFRKSAIPEFGWLTSARLAQAQQANQLSTVCYNQPATSTAQSVWRRIRVSINGSRVIVDSTIVSGRVADGPVKQRRQTSVYEIRDGWIDAVPRSAPPPIR